MNKLEVLKELSTHHPMTYHPQSDTFTADSRIMAIVHKALKMLYGLFGYRLQNTLCSLDDMCQETVAAKALKTQVCQLLTRAATPDNTEQQRKIYKLLEEHGIIPLRSRIRDATSVCNFATEKQTQNTAYMLKLLQDHPAIKLHSTQLLSNEELLLKLVELDGTNITRMNALRLLGTESSVASSKKAHELAKKLCLAALRQNKDLFDEMTDFLTFYNLRNNYEFMHEVMTINGLHIERALILSPSSPFDYSHIRNLCLAALRQNEEVINNQGLREFIKDFHFGDNYELALKVMQLDGLLIQHIEVTTFSELAPMEEKIAIYKKLCQAAYKQNKASAPLMQRILTHYDLKMDDIQSCD